MRAIVLTCAALLIAGVAAAQGTSVAPAAAPSAFEPQFDERPDPLRARMYPERALERSVQGLAFACCTAQADRTLRCRPASERPDRSGFAASTSSFMRGARLTEASAAALQARSQTEFAIGMLYQINGSSPQLDAVAAQVRARATDVCGVGTGPAPEFIVVTASRVRRR